MCQCKPYVNRSTVVTCACWLLLLLTLSHNLTSVRCLKVQKTWVHSQLIWQGGRSILNVSFVSYDVHFEFRIGLLDHLKSLGCFIVIFAKSIYYVVSFFYLKNILTNCLTMENYTPMPCLNSFRNTWTKYVLLRTVRVGYPVVIFSSV